MSKDIVNHDEPCAGFDMAESRPNSIRKFTLAVYDQGVYHVKGEIADHPGGCLSFSEGFSSLRLMIEELVKSGAGKPGQKVLVRMEILPDGQEG